jgi:SAM-dependent methyltransferase
MISRSERCLTGIAKAWWLVRSGRLDLLLAIPCYRMTRRLRGLDLGIAYLGELGLDSARAHYYKDGGGPLLNDLVKKLDIKESDAALDYGSGKAGAMITLARFPFRKVDGVEISPQLVAVAERNLAKLKIAKSRVFLADAADFTDLDDYNYIFLYNPFPAVVLKQVLDNLAASLQRNPRTLRLVYNLPADEETVLDAGIFKKTFVYQPYPGYDIIIYENNPASAADESRRHAAGAA